MTVRDLKNFFAKIPPDADDVPVALVTATEGQRRLDLVVGFGYIPVSDEQIAIAIVGMREIERRVESGEMPAPPDYRKPPAEPGEEWKQS